MSSPVAPRASVELIRTLVGFPTVSRDSKLALIDWVREYLRPWDPDIRLTLDDDRRKANLFATLGPRGMPGIVLSGHTDVVPVEGQDWATDPFMLAEKDGGLYGRGTSDMKSFIACVLAAVPEIMRRGLATPLHLAFSYDEEVGCLGVGRLIADLAAAGIRPQSCIVGEPTLMRPVIGHKGKKGYRCTVRGFAAHSAYAPHGVNAVEFAAEAVAFLRGMARRHRDPGPYDRGFDVAHTTVHPHRDLVRWYSAADVFCLLSEREGCPNVLMEAMACGLPSVVCGDWVDQAMIPSEEIGFVSPTRDPKALSVLMLRALTHMWDRGKIRKFSLQRSWDEVARQIRTIFGETGQCAG